MFSKLGPIYNKKNGKNQWSSEKGAMRIRISPADRYQPFMIHVSPAG